jgi:hypothetical protein
VGQGDGPTRSVGFRPRGRGTCPPDVGGRGTGSDAPTAPTSLPFVTRCSHGGYGGAVGPVERKVPPPDAPGPATSTRWDQSPVKPAPGAADDLSVGRGLRAIWCGSSGAPGTLSCWGHRPRHAAVRCACYVPSVGPGARFRLSWSGSGPTDREGSSPMNRCRGRARWAGVPASAPAA